MLKKLRIKLLCRTETDLCKEIKCLLDEISDDLEDIHNDICNLQESVQEQNRLILIIQEQCQELIAIMEKNKGENNE